MRLAGAQSSSHSFMLNGFISFIIIFPGKQDPGANVFTISFLWHVWHRQWSGI